MSEMTNGAIPDTAPMPTPPDTGNVDKIRDILFGSQMRDYDRRFSTLEERLSAHGFLRVHRAELIRLDAVKSLSTSDGMHEVKLADGQAAPSSSVVHKLTPGLGV